VPLDPRTTFAVVTGASEWPSMAGFEGPREPFRHSAERLTDYLRSHSGLGLVASHVLSLFDDKRDAAAQRRALRDFLRREIIDAGFDGGVGASLLFYYVGHGAYGASQAYCLLVRASEDRYVDDTSLRLSSIETVLRNEVPRSRRFLILDSCFAAAAVASFLAPVEDVAFGRALEVLDQPGVAFLCAAGKREAAQSMPGDPTTMFSGALVDLLEHGDESISTGLSLRRLSDLIWQRLRAQYGESAVRPQVHAPMQGAGDLATEPLFPNPSARSSTDGEDEGPHVPGLAHGAEPTRRRAWIITAAVAALLLVAVVGVIMARNGEGTPTASGHCGPVEEQSSPSKYPAALGGLPPGVLPSDSGLLVAHQAVWARDIDARCIVAADEVHRTTTSLRVGSEPFDIVATGNRSRGDAQVWVTYSGGHTVGVIDANQLDQLRVARTIDVGANPTGIALSPDGEQVWVAVSGANRVAVINRATGTVAARVAVGQGPVNIRVGARFAWTANFDDNSVTRIDTTNYQTANFRTCGQPIAAALHDERFWVACYADDKVDVFTPDAPPETPPTELATGNAPVALRYVPRDNVMYIVNYGSGTLTSFDTTTLQPKFAPVEVGRGAVGVDGGGKMYVANYREPELIELDVAHNTLAVKRRVIVPTGARSVEVVQSGVWIAHVSAAELTFVDPDVNPPRVDAVSPSS
jgi:YVTN family beta-propeller protein